MPANARVVRGQIVNVTLELVAPLAGAGAWAVDVRYNPANVQPVSCTGSAGGTLCNLSPSGTQNTIRAAGADPNGLRGTVTLATLSLRAVAAASTLTVELLTIPLNALSVDDVEGNPVQVGATGGRVTVLPYAPDVNGTGGTTATDALCILRLVGGFAPTTACPNPLVMADVNGDGTVTASDALCVLRFVGGFAPSTACPQAQALIPAASVSASPAAALAAPGEDAAVLLRVTPSTATLAPGGTTTVKVEAVALAGLGSWTVDLAYDPATVQPVACTTEAGGAGALCNLKPEGTTGIVRVTGVETGALSGTLTLAAVRFQAVGTESATGPLRLTAMTLTDMAGAPLTASVMDGSLTVGR